MNPAATMWALAAVAAVGLTASVVTYVLERCILRAGAVYYGTLSVAFLVMTAWQIGGGELANAGVFLASSAVTGWIAHVLWRNRGKRKRRPSKVAARVRDLGHRLAVVPAGAPS